MIQISVINSVDGKEVVQIKVCDRISIVAGDSGSGKSFTAFASDERNEDLYKLSVVDLKTNEAIGYTLCDSQTDLENFINSKNTDRTVCIIDEYLAGKLCDNKKQVLRQRMYKKCAYFVVFQRDYINKFELGISSIYELVLDNGLIINKRLIGFNEVKDVEELEEIDLILMEDNSSGFTVIRHFFQPDKQIAKSLGQSVDDLNLIDVIRTNGNGDIIKELKNLHGRKILTFLDYDRASYIFSSLLCAVKSNEIDLSNVIFVRAELFEEIACNSKMMHNIPEVNIDAIEHIENYMDCSFESRGEYFIYMLKTNFVDTQYKNGKAVTRPRYSKNNPACFKRNCSDCGNAGCSLRDTSDDKINLTFTGKYKFIVEFYYMLKERKALKNKSGQNQDEKES